MTAIAERRLSEALEAIAARVGFRLLGKLTLLREMEGGEHQLKFGGAFRGGSFFFTMTVCLRFEAIQAALGAAEDRELPTVMVPMHLLHQNRDFFEWSFAVDERPGPDLLLSVESEINRYALPFLARFSQLGELRKSLESQNPEEWFTLSPVQRLCTLSAVRWVSGDENGAVALLNDALSGSLAPRKARQLEEQRDRMQKGQT